MNLGWQDIPAHRVLILTMEVFKEDYDRLDNNGDVMFEGAMMVPTLIRRKRDGRLFCISQWQPESSSSTLHIIALREA